MTRTHKGGTEEYIILPEERTKESRTDREERLRLQAAWKDKNVPLDNDVRHVIKSSRVDVDKGIKRHTVPVGSIEVTPSQAAQIEESKASKEQQGASEALEALRKRYARNEGISIHNVLAQDPFAAWDFVHSSSMYEAHPRFKVLQTIAEETVLDDLREDDNLRHSLSEEGMPKISGSDIRKMARYGELINILEKDALLGLIKPESKGISEDSEEAA